MEQAQFEEFKKISMPVVEFLKTYYDPHATAIITWDYIKIVRDEFGMPL